MMTKDKSIVKATELRAGDLVEMVLAGIVTLVRIAKATVGKTYGGVECVHVHGVGPDGVLVDIDYSLQSSFKAISLKADRLRADIADLEHIRELTNDDNAAREAADARDQLIAELEELDK
jgi:hypothetical protein